MVNPAPLVTDRRDRAMVNPAPLVTDRRDRAMVNPALLVTDRRDCAMVNPELLDAATLPSEHESEHHKQRTASAVPIENFGTRVRTPASVCKAEFSGQSRKEAGVLEPLAKHESHLYSFDKIVLAKH